MANEQITWNGKYRTRSDSSAAAWSRDPEYQCWANMIQRCTNPNNKHYKDYGGRGITVDPRWLASFRCFLQDMGLRPVPSYSLDRRDNDGNYEKSNCRWASKLMQIHNRSRKGE
jgi:hypothetical protein